MTTKGGYIPTAKAYLEGGYEPTVALAGPDSEAIRLAALRKLLKAEGKGAGQQNPDPAKGEAKPPRFQRKAPRRPFGPRAPKPA